mmetsp:Transcript_31923/g.35366  ORF Transcript_31923/g.35366 Transcript_31923/m.35366 type:complete len:361 (-) Transcript_31923:429-1511(-)
MTSNGVPPPTELAPVPMFAPSDPVAGATSGAVDLDDLFRDCYFGDFPIAPFSNEIIGVPAVPPGALQSTPSMPIAPIGTAPIGTVALSGQLAPVMVAAPAAPVHSGPQLSVKRTAEEAALTDSYAQITSATHNVKQLTDQQKVERRERNREHAKRSRLRKKFLLESLQEQIHGLQAEIETMKDVIRKEIPDKAEKILKELSGDKDKFTPLPMPSGFGPVKTLMEPDFRLMSALSGSQQNFAISDPSLPDNPIVYVSQGFLDLTGYKLDQVLGRNCRFLQGPGTDQSAVEVIRRGIREGVDTSVCLLNYKADGTPFWNQFFVAALRDAENNVVNFVGVQCEVSKAVVEKQIAEGKMPPDAK